MIDLFLNPWAMLAGTALISSPILIHLINRMRFKRIRWAAMEFLLKSQKRNRRKLIIEQMILLLLRILLVMLAGLLLARFLGFGGASGEQSTTHVILLDDTPSMADFHREDGESRDAFSQARRSIIEEIAVPAGQAKGVQSVELYRLTPLGKVTDVDQIPDLAPPYKVERLNPSTIDELKGHLAGLQVATVHVDLLHAVRRLRERLDRIPGRKMFHIVSDFRARDWTGAEANAAALTKEFESLRDAKVQVHFLDVAHPERKESQQAALYHDNLGLIDLQPETRVVAKAMPVEFNLTVGNFSNSDRRTVRVNVKVNGVARQDSSFTIEQLPPGVKQVSFVVPSLNRVGTKERPMDRFNVVTASLENEEAGLAIDNSREAVVEVRDRVPILMIENDTAKPEKPESESYYLRAIFRESAKGYDFLVDKGARLERDDLDQFPSIWLLNVPRLSDKAEANLKKYVANGGGVGFFMGSECKPEFYNRLYEDGKGVFPAPLDDKPSAELSDIQKLERNYNVQQAKLFVRNENHPILSRIYKDDKARENSKYLKFVGIDRYWPVKPGWRPDGRTVQEVLTLPNDKSVDAYARAAQALLEKLQGRANDPKNEKFKASLEAHRRAVAAELVPGQPLYTLASELDNLLNDSGVPANTAGMAERPDLREFWQQPEQAELRDEFTQLTAQVRYGDPLLVAKGYGKGRVTAYFTTAGVAWNNFAKFLGQPYYVMLMVELQKYLASTASDANRMLGQPVEFRRDSVRYAAKVKRYYMGSEDFKAGAESVRDPEAQGEDAAAETVKDQHVFRFDNALKPGVYLFEFTTQPDGATEQVAEAFNVDTMAEGDLRRVSRDDLLQAAPGSTVHAPGGSLANVLNVRQRDFSESPWIYLMFLLLLVAEQALAVRLSFHAPAGGDTGAPAVVAPRPA